MMERNGLGLVAFIGLSYGIVLIVTGSKIFQPIRRGVDSRSLSLGYLLHCPMCFGFWTGLLLSLWLGGGPCLFLSTIHSNALRALADGAFTAGTCWAAHVLLRALGAEEL